MRILRRDAAGAGGHERGVRGLRGMEDWLEILLLTLMAGMAIPSGAMLARLEQVLPEWHDNELRHWVMAFGAGALISAVALVLVPKGAANLSMGAVVVSFGGGGVAMLAVDRLLARAQSQASQMVAMLSDFVPEALALGAAFAYEPQTAILLAAMITLQNLPEGFNAYRELMDGRKSGGGRLIVAFLAMALLGPACGLAGYFWLTDHAVVVSWIMMFGAGGILYLVLQDIAPQAKLERHWAPALGGVAGFLLGTIGHMMTG